MAHVVEMRKPEAAPDDELDALIAHAHRVRARTDQLISQAKELKKAHRLLQQEIEVRQRRASSGQTQAARSPQLQARTRKAA
jgi:hypothetical protein